MLFFVFDSKSEFFDSKKEHQKKEMNEMNDVQFFSFYFYLYIKEKQKTNIEILKK